MCLRRMLRATPAMWFIWGTGLGAQQKPEHDPDAVVPKFPDHWKAVQRFDMKDVLPTHNLSKDLRLRPDDKLYVPKNTPPGIKTLAPTSSIGIYAPTR